MGPATHSPLQNNQRANPDFGRLVGSRTNSSHGVMDGCSTRNEMGTYQLSDLQFKKDFGSRAFDHSTSGHRVDWSQLEKATHCVTRLGRRAFLAGHIMMRVVCWCRQTNDTRKSDFTLLIRVESDSHPPRSAALKPGGPRQIRNLGGATCGRPPLPTQWPGDAHLGGGGGFWLLRADQSMGPGNAGPVQMYSKRVHSFAIDCTEQRSLAESTDFTCTEARICCFGHASFWSARQ
jgi:hypothetical protein